MQFKVYKRIIIMSERPSSYPVCQHLLSATPSTSQQQKGLAPKEPLTGICHWHLQTSSDGLDANRTHHKRGEEGGTAGTVMFSNPTTLCSPLPTIPSPLSLWPLGRRCQKSLGNKQPHIFLYSSSPVWKTGEGALLSQRWKMFLKVRLTEECPVKR